MVRVPFIGRVSGEQVAVVVSGIVSMGLEILAGRVIAPHFGSTIYTWGSIIGISMLALSLGYHYGGKNSSNIGRRELENFLLYTSFYIIFIMFVGDRILALSSALPVPPIYGSIVPVTLLFGPPTFFLGFISPYAVQLSSKEVKGEASGHFYAVGTAGSIVGAFGTTFVLIPNLAVDHIYMFFAVLSVLPLLFRGGLRSLYFPAVIVVGAVLMQGVSFSGNVIHSESTAYQELEVTRSDNLTTLYLDGQPQSAKYMNSNETPWEYMEYFYVPFLMQEDVDNALFIGGGGFVGPQQYAQRGIEVDAVELDPAVVDAAEEYFNLSESENLSVHVMDGRQYLEQTNETYDVVILDAYRKSEVPFHLTTQEFMELIHDRTDEDGVVVSNVISTSSGPGSQFSRSYYKTMDREFESTYYFPTRDTDYAQNIEIVASKNPALSEQELYEQNKYYEDKNLSGQISRLQKVETDDVPVLKDDYAPVERLLNPLVGQKYVVN